MRPIGEYPTPAEYRAAGVKPHRPPTSENATPTLGSDSGFENPTFDNGPADRLAEALKIATAAQSPDVETPVDNSTPAIANAAINISEYHAVLRELPLPPSPSEQYDMLKLRDLMLWALDDAVQNGSSGECMGLVHFWYLAGTDNFTLSLIENLSRGGEANLRMSNALRLLLNELQPEACEWYQIHTGGVSLFPVDQVPVSDSGRSSAVPAGPDAAFKVSDIYRDTSGPRLEELFMSGKSNTAPLKRPKKPHPANEAAYRRKLAWDSDPHHDEKMQEIRARMSRAQPTMADVQYAQSALRGQPAPGMNPLCHVHTFEAMPHYPPGPYDHFSVSSATRPILRYPVPDQDSEPEPASPVPTADDTADDNAMDTAEDNAEDNAEATAANQKRTRNASKTPTQKPDKKSGKKPGKKSGKEPQNPSKTQKGKRPQLDRPRSERSVSVDTTLSEVSSLSNSCYSVRYNDWTAEHGPRQMPNSMYVFCVTSIFLLLH